MYQIKLTKITVKNLKTIEKKTLKKIFNKIESLKEEPYLLGKPLQCPLSEYRSIRAA